MLVHAGGPRALGVHGMLTRTFCQSSLLKSQIARLDYRLAELEKQTRELRAQMAEIKHKLEPDSAPTLVPEIPAKPERVLRSGSVVMKKRLLKKQMKPLLVEKPSPVNKRQRNSMNGQHDFHVRRYRKLAYMREYMRIRKTNESKKATAI
jgi:hypothetical protein